MALIAISVFLAPLNIKSLPSSLAFRFFEAVLFTFYSTNITLYSRHIHM